VSPLISLLNPPATEISQGNGLRLDHGGGGRKWWQCLMLETQGFYWVDHDFIWLLYGFIWFYGDFV
jgi:hypothetical protein